MRIRSEMNYITLVGLSLSVALAARHYLPADAVVLCRHNALVYLVSDSNPYESVFSNQASIFTTSDSDEKVGYSKLTIEWFGSYVIEAIKPLVKPELKRSLQVEKLVVDGELQPLCSIDLFFRDLQLVFSPGSYGWSAIALSCMPVRAGPSADLCYTIFA